MQNQICQIYSLPKNRNKFKSILSNIKITHLACYIISSSILRNKKRYTDNAKVLLAHFAASNNLYKHTQYTLASLAGKVQCKTLARLHAKFILTESGQAIVSSCNYTKSGLTRNYELITIYKSNEYFIRLRNIFRSLWRKGVRQDGPKPAY